MTPSKTKPSLNLNAGIIEHLNTIKDFPKDKTLHRLFEEQVRKTPARTALIVDDKRYTYEDLNKKSNRLARTIRRRYRRETGRPMGADTLIALCLDRSVEMIVSILAVLKAGGAYVPIDGNYPQERVDYILEDTGAPLILGTHSPGSIHLPQDKVLSVDSAETVYQEEESSNLEPVAEPTDLAYVIYTSGTTGKPKGVLQLHTNVHRLLSSTEHLFHFDENDVWTLFHSYVFDFSVWELWGPLTTGGTLVVPLQDQVKDFNLFYELCLKHRVSILNHTPSAFYQFSETIRKNGRQKLSFRTIIFGGEALSTRRLRTWWDYQEDQGLETRLVNMYGITETTVHVTYKLLDPNDTDTSNIGRPIEDLKAYVLDSNLRNVPVGTEGELYVGGAGLARGYLNLPRLTEERFIPDPFATRDEIERGYTKLYKTGDVVRLRPDGDLEYLGRNDDQVKIRGFRIELGEIENQMVDIDGISQACVLLKERSFADADGTVDSKYLAAYLTLDPASHRDLSRDVVLEILRGKLPEHMVPSVVMVVDRFPLTINGKLDKKALPEPDWGHTTGFVEPRNALEKQVCAIWNDVLKLPRVGIDDDFFRIGGDSILSIRIVARMQELGVPVGTKDIYRERTVRGILQGENTALQTTPKYEPFSLLDPADIDGILRAHEWSPADIEDMYPTSYLQNGMLIEYERSHAYHVVTRFRVNLPYDARKFRATWAHLVARHAPLRNSFILDETYGYLNVQHRRVDVGHKIKHLNVSEENWKDYFSSQWALSLDIQVPGLFLLDILDQGENTFTFVLTTHHVIEDGWSIASLMAEFVDVYSGSKAALDKGMPLKVPRYAEYIAKELGSYRSQPHQAFWRDYLSDYEIPAGRLLLESGSQAALATSRPEGGQFVVAQDLAAPLNARILALGHELGLSPNIIFAAAYLWVLHKLTATDDLVIGTVVNNRLEETGGDRVFGLHLNTIPFRSRLTGHPGPSFRDYVFSVLENKIQVGEWQLYPYGKMKADLKMEQDLFQCAFNYVHFHIGEEHYLSGVLEDGYPHESTHIPLTLHVYRRENSFCIETKGRPDFIDEPTCHRVLHYVETVLDQVTGDPDLPIGRCRILDPDEFQRVVLDWNATDTEYPKAATLCGLFEEQVRKTPEKPAVIFDGNTLSYRELNEKSNRLARQIRDVFRLKTGQELKPSTLIALCLDRSLEMVVAILAVLKAGAAYVPLDKDYPQERIDHILGDTGTELILTQRSVIGGPEQSPPPAPHLPEQKILMVDLSESFYLEQESLDLSTETRSSDLCYVIYTSGTTGLPKGVQLQHHAVVNRLLWMIEGSEIETSDHFLCKTHYVFDVSVSDIFAHLLKGSTLTLTRQILDPEELDSHIESGEITSIHFLPSQYVLFAEKIKGSSIRKIYFSGEPLHQNIIRQLEETDPKIRFYNYYGPTESGEITLSRDNYAATDFSIIGRVAANNKAFVLDRDMQPVPVGVLGELYLSGANLAQDYLNLPGLTRERFVENPFVDPETSDESYRRLYKTGDLVRWLPDGALEYIGRNDSQVKLRGFRVELEEIQNQLSSIDGVAQACVLLKERDPAQPDSRYLVGYYLPDLHLAEPHLAEPLSAQSIASRLRETLPDYMIPEILTAVDHFPLTANGKLDKKALPEAVPVDADHHVAPRTGSEIRLAEIWQEILSRPRVGVTDDFFRVGGNSLSAIQATRRMQDVLGQDMKITDLFRFKTIEQLVKRHSNGAVGDGRDLIFVYNEHLQSGRLHPRFSRAPSREIPTKDMLMIHPGNGGAEVYRSLAEKLGHRLRCLGIDNHHHRNLPPIHSLSALAEHYLALYLSRFQPERRPLCLLGWSLGGQIALKMAGRLEGMGRHDVKVFLLDTVVPDSKLRSLQEGLDLDELKSHIKHRILKDYESSYVNTILAAVEAEHALHYAPTTEYETLKSTEVLLFKACHENPAVAGQPLLEKMNRHILSQLPQNNIETLADRLKVVSLPCSHSDVLSQEEEILRHIP